MLRSNGKAQPRPQEAEDRARPAKPPQDSAVWRRMQRVLYRWRTRLRTVLLRRACRFQDCHHLTHLGLLVGPLYRLMRGPQGLLPVRADGVPLGPVTQ